jgi:thioredoxin 1
MKKVSIYIIVIVALFGLIFVLNRQEKDPLYDKPVSDLNPATREILKDPNYQNIILPKELDAKLQNGESFYTYFFASDCVHCRNTTPILMPIVKDLGVDLPQFNLREFPEYFNKMNIEYTPTLIYFNKGKPDGMLVGGIKAEGTNIGYSEQDIVDFFKQHGTKGDAS